MQASGRPWLLRLSSSQMESKCYSEQPVLCRGLRAQLPRCRVGSTRWPPCVPGASWHDCTVCAAGHAADMCRVLVAAEAGSVRKDGKTALGPAAMADARDAALVLAACEKEAGQRDTNGFTALMGAVQHRNTDLARLLLRREAGIQKNDGTAAIHIAVFLEDAALVKMLCPYEKELQLADGRTAHMIAAALNNPALHAVFEEPKRKRARSRAEEHQGQVAADLRGVHAPVRGADSSHCPRPGLPRTPGVHNTRPERPGLRSPSAARGHAQRTGDVYYLSHALPLQTNHQQRKPTRPPTTTTAATEIPAIAPLLRLGSLLLAVPSLTR